MNCKKKAYTRNYLLCLTLNVLTITAQGLLVNEFLDRKFINYGIKIYKERVEKIL